MPFNQNVAKVLEVGREHAPEELTGQDCWFGGECYNKAVYSITHGHTAFQPETRAICEKHLNDMIKESLREVRGWGKTLPVLIEKIP